MYDILKYFTHGWYHGRRDFNSIYDLGRREVVEWAFCGKACEQSKDSQVALSGVEHNMPPS